MAEREGFTQLSDFSHLANKNCTASPVINQELTSQVYSPKVLFLQDLAPYEQWVYWQLIQYVDEPKPRKVPYSPKTTTKARSNKPSTWSTLQRATLAAPKKDGGIGIMLGKVEGLDVQIGGLDLDTCRDPATGQIDPWAIDILKRFDSYSEISPSGTGVKILFLHNDDEAQAATFKAKGKSHPPGIELYFSKRYFAITKREYWPEGDAIENHRRPLRMIDPKALQWLLDEAGPLLRGEDDQAANDESSSGAAYRMAIKMHLNGETVEHFEAWAVEHPWGDYDCDADRAIERTWKRARVDAGEMALADRANGAHEFEDLGDDPESPKGKTKFEVTATPFTVKGLQAIPKRELYYSTHYGPGLLSAMAATGGMGKSMLTIGECLAIATGKPILGESLRMGAKRVWHINSEDDKEELDRRFEAAIQHHEITQSDLGDRLFYTGNETRFIVATEGRDGLKIATPVVEAIKAEIKRLGIDVLTIDPFVSTHAVSENSNDRVNAVAGLWRTIAQECNCAVMLVHHMRKPASAKPGQAQTNYSIDDARGAGAFKDATRSFRVINRMSETMASKLGLDDPWRYLHVTDGKANYAPPSSAGKWFKLVSVGASEADHGTGAVEAWEFPAAMAGITFDDVKLALDALADGTGRQDTQSPNWAGNRVAVALSIDKSERTKLKAMLGQWVKAGYLTIEERQDSKRMLRDFYVVSGQPKSDFEELDDEFDCESESQ
jgi:AAA domain